MATPTQEQRERIKADIAKLKQQLERRDLTDAQRTETHANKQRD